MDNIKVLQMQLDLKLRKITRAEYNEMMTKYYEDEMEKISKRLGIK